MSNETEIFDNNCVAGSSIGASIKWVPDHNALQVAATALQVRKDLGLLDEDETAAVLKLTSTNTLATWRSLNSGPPSVKLGKRVFYTKSGLANWINAKIQEQEAAAKLAA